MVRAYFRKLGTLETYILGGGYPIPPPTLPPALAKSFNADTVNFDINNLYVCYVWFVKWWSQSSFYIYLFHFIPLRVFTFVPFYIASWSPHFYYHLSHFQNFPYFQFFQFLSTLSLSLSLSLSLTWKYRLSKIYGVLTIFYISLRGRLFFMVIST